MHSFQLVLDSTSKVSMYFQIYQYLRDGILVGDISKGEKLPSLRIAAKVLGVSLTTVSQAYNQLTVEGYVQSLPKSGYFVSNIGTIGHGHYLVDAHFDELHDALQSTNSNQGCYIDPECFDFVKWKKCLNQILTDYPHLLLSEATPQGEQSLRHEISRYAFQHRGVRCSPNQILVGAGIQPIIDFLCIVLKKQGIGNLTIENPGFPVVQRIFSDRDFEITPIPVDPDGIRIAALPNTMNNVAYVSPSNQFPLGSVMPIGKRYALLDWARTHQNYILEDDYDSELRYFGKPIPSLQGMDTDERVIYLGSFSGTLFPSIKISYLILPKALLKYALKEIERYRQTCSKSEQLTLALYMRNGLFQTHIKKLRRLYAQKMHRTSESIRKCFNGSVQILHISSGVHMVLAVESTLPASELCQRARLQQLEMTPITYFADETESANEHKIIFYFTKIPIDEIEASIKSLSKAWSG